ncbi:hypothetical protein BN14_06490 [Rhizoctonia solani AG-1 IB]|uniref:Globin-sensor domain-containing protein n=2 Tax=Rhizoctonia solani TaxID=456999 RepID=A0A8H3B9D9_9AGAM|nr:unnamed protein product [Rhizoctonia solani]CCO32430.1 hypothetical protein BN14_06490 [Rhizoctonia solani AG-1 IB]
MCPILNRVDPVQLETSLPKRVEYVTKFMEFGPEDAAALRAAAPIVKQITNCAVDAVYEKLFSFDVTRATFLSRNTGFEGKLATRLEEISHESEQIKFRYALRIGHVHNMLTRAVLARNLPAETTQTTLVAINKVLWIQNDLFARHYIPPHHSVPEESETKDKGGAQGWGWGLFGRSAGSSSSS